MKKIYLSLALLLAGFTLTAQNKDTEAADMLFNQSQYVDAAEAYLKLSGKKDPYVYRQLAESYYNVFNTKEAVKWYAKAAENSKDAEVYYRYAQMLKAEGRYEEANKQMQKFTSLAPKDARAVEFSKDPDYLPKLRSQTKLFDEQILKINDKKYTDFGAVLASDGNLYFTSARNTSKRTYKGNEEPYLDVYMAAYNDNGTLSEPVPVSEINTKYHDGPVAITADGNTMYFASESYVDGKFEKDKGSDTKASNIFLFRATKENGKWGNIEPVPFNDKQYSTNSPAISKDGKTLYFSSNRKGTLGSTDIWKVEVKGNNKYGTPENLGPKVNTAGREGFPYITDDNRLYFSSEGRQGFGQLDIFVIDLAKGGEAVNVGQPVNSQKDDFAFSFNTDKNIGFFSSNRTGKDNMYKAIPVCGVEALVTVKDKKTGKIIPNAKVAILDDKNNIIETAVSDANGLVNYNVDCERAYVLQVAADGYVNNTLPLIKNKGGKVNIPADLNPIDNIITKDGITLNEIRFEYNKSNITKEAAFELDRLIEAMKKNPDIVIMIKAHTDNRGSDEYNMTLSNQRAVATVQYALSRGIPKSRISGQGYGETEPKVKCGENCTEEQHAQNRRIEFLIVKK